MQCHDKIIRSCILPMLWFLLAIGACAQESRWNALRRAQMKERDQVTEHYGRDLPYYWGAFILVGR
jgi:hypothetical protein